MDLFTDSTYFIGELLIANVEKPAMQQLLGIVIGAREPEYLKKVMGYECYKAFEEGLSENEPEQRWLDVKEGTEYRDCSNRLKNWQGFVNDEKVSPIANYVYFWHQRNQITFSTSTGEKTTKGENSDNASSIAKLYRAWNTCSDLTYTLHALLQSKKEDGTAVYPEFDILDAERIDKTNWL